MPVMEWLLLMKIALYKKVNADYLLEQIYDSLKKRETEQEAKSFDVCEYLLQMIKNR